MSTKKTFNIKEWKDNVLNNTKLLNEGLKIDKKLAKITLDAIIPKKDQFSQEVYLSAWDRENIRDEFGSKLPRGFASANKAMMSSELLNPFLEQGVYMDGTSLVQGDKTIMQIKSSTTWSDVIKKLGIRI